MNDAEEAVAELSQMMSQKSAVGRQKIVEALVRVAVDRDGHDLRKLRDWGQPNSDRSTNGNDRTAISNTNTRHSEVLSFRFRLCVQRAFVHAIASWAKVAQEKWL